MMNRLEQYCPDHGLRIRGPCRVIIRVINEARDHPSAAEIHQRVVRIDPRISLATVYRTLNLFVEAGLLDRLALGEHKSRYEEAGSGHHEHLIDVGTGKVLEFRDAGIEALVRQAATQLGYRLVNYRLELFGEAPPTSCY